MNNVTITKQGKFLIADTKPLAYAGRPYKIQKDETVIDKIVDNKYMIVAGKHTDDNNITSIIGKATSINKSTFIDKNDGNEYIGAFAGGIEFNPKMLRNIPKGVYGFSIEMDYNGQNLQVKDGVLTVPADNADVSVVALVTTPRHGIKDIDLTNDTVKSLYDSSDFQDGECIIIATDDTVYLQDSADCAIILSKENIVKEKNDSIEKNQSNLGVIADKIVASIKENLPALFKTADNTQEDILMNKEELIAILDDRLKDHLDTKLEVALTTLKDNILENLSSNQNKEEISTQLEELKKQIEISEAENKQLKDELTKKEELIQTMSDNEDKENKHKKEKVTDSDDTNINDFSFLKDINK